LIIYKGGKLARFHPSKSAAALATATVYHLMLRLFVDYTMS